MTFLRRPFWEWVQVRTRQLAGADTLPEADAFVQQHYPRNFAANVLDAGFFLFGLSFASATVILPLFLQQFTSSEVVLGFITGLIEAGTAFPQLFMVGLINRQTRQLPLVGWLAVPPRTVFLLLGLLALYSPQLPPLGVVGATLGLLALYGVTIGMSASPWQELMAKVIPQARRGRFFGVRMMLGGLLGVGGAALASWLLGVLPFPSNFAWCMFVAFGCLMLSWGMLLFTREAPTPARTHLAASSGAWWLPLRHNPNFARFIAAYALLTLGSMATGFYAVYALGHFGLTAGQASWLNTIWFAANTVSNLLWGWVNDRFGPKRVLVGSAGVQTLALVLAGLAPNVWVFAAAFACASVGVAGVFLGGLTLPLVIGPEAERPLYIGLTNTLRAPAAVCAPLLGGWLAHQFGYPAMFSIAIAVSVVGVGSLSLAVRLPKSPGL